MRQETFAILFLMRKGRPKKNGLAPIFARITTGGLRQEVYTQCDSNPETWNQHKERAMGTNKLAIQVNERLNDFRVKIIDIRTKLLAEGYAANAAQIKQRYLNPTCNTMMLIAGLADYAKRRQGEVGVRITQRTADKYERLLRYLKQYLAQRGYGERKKIFRRGARYAIRTKASNFNQPGKRGASKSYAAVHNTDPALGLYTVNQYSSRRPEHRQFIGINPKLNHTVNQLFIPILFRGFPFPNP